MTTDTITLDRSVVEQALEDLQCTAYPQDYYETVKALRAALEQQVEQQPVAWQGRDGYLYHFIEEPKPGDRPLYTHPQSPRQPLTDDQIGELMMQTWGCASIAPRHAPSFARAIEAAHGIGGEQE